MPPAGPLGPGADLLITCTADARVGRVSCGAPGGTPTIGGVGDLVVGGQRVYVTLTSSGAATTAGQTCAGVADATKKCFAFDVTVTNLIPQPMGTTDGTTPVASGLQVFFLTGPLMTGGSGSVVVANAFGTGIFTSTGQKYFQYAGTDLGADQILVTNETSSAQRWKLDCDVTVTNFAFQLYVSAPVPKPDGWVDLAITSGGAATAVASVARGATQQLYPTPKAAVGRVLAGSAYGSVTYASTNSSVASVDPSTGVVTGVANGTATITATTVETSGPTITGQVAVTVSSASPSATADAYDVQMGMQLGVATNNGVLANDVDADDPASALTVTRTADVANGVLTLSADGTFTYLPNAGYTGTDSFSYTVSDGSSTSSTTTVTLTVSGRTWWVDGGAAGAHDGRQATPFLTLNDAEAVAIAGDSILVSGGGSTTGATLKTSQAVIGAGIGASITRTLNATPASQAQNITLLTSTGSQTSVAGAVTVAAGNSLAGVAIGGTVTGSSFGTLSVAAASINNPSGQALSLTTGTLVGAFTAITSGGGTNNILLSSVSTAGTADLGGSSGALSGASSTAVLITGGAGSFSYAGSIGNTTLLAVNVNSKSGGTATLSGNINPVTPGGGISVANNTGGSVIISGSVKQISSGTATGVNIANNSGATITISGGGLTIASTTGTPFNATGVGTVEVSGSGNTIAVSGAAASAVNMNSVTIAPNGITFNSITSSGTTTASAISSVNVDGGTFTATSLTVAGTSGATSRGIQFISNSAAFTFGSASINGTGGEGVYLNNNSGAVAINGGTVGNSVNTTGDALFVSSGSAPITVAASLSKSSAGRVTSIAAHSAGAVTVSGTLSCTAACTGISVSANSGGTITFSGTTKTITTGANPGVTLSSNTGATVSFGNGGLAIATTTGKGFNVTSGGTVTVGTGTNPNTISSTTGTALNVASTTIGAGGLTFRSISANGGSNGIVLNTTGSSGGLTVTGDGVTAGSGGTIQNTTGTGTAGTGIYLDGTTSVSLSWMSIHDHSTYAVYGTAVTGFTMRKSRITGTNGIASTSGGAMYFENLYGSALVANSYVTGGGLDNVHVFNGFPSPAAAALNRITFDTDTIFGNLGGSNINIAAYNTSVVKATIQSSTFTSSRGSTINFTTNENSSGDVVITGNTITNTDPNQVSGTTGIYVGNASSGASTYLVQNNSVNGMFGSGIEVDRLAGGAGPMGGSVRSNTVGTSGVDGSGSRDGVAIFIGLVNNNTGAATHTDTVANNTVKQFGNYGIKLVNRGPGLGYLDALVLNNTITEHANSSVTLFPTGGIRWDIGTASGDDGKVCAVNTGNVVSNAGSNGGEELRVRGRFSTKTGIPGVGADPNALYQASNTLTGATPVNATSTNPFQSSCPPI